MPSLGLIELATAAWLIIVTSSDPAHRQVNAFRYGSMRECLDALQGTQIRLHADELRTAYLLEPPKCTNMRPVWWKDR